MTLLMNVLETKAPTDHRTEHQKNLTDDRKETKSTLLMTVLGRKNLSLTVLRIERPMLCTVLEIDWTIL